MTMISWAVHENKTPIAPNDIQGPPERPVNSPPTYDDAMKHVNEAFQYDEDDDVGCSEHGQDEADLPPEYTEQVA